MEINVKTKEDFGSIMMNVGKKGALYIFGAGKYGKIFGEFFRLLILKSLGQFG